MRYIGILMMAGALAAGGFWAADQWKEKLELLLLFRQMMFYLKGQILYANATLPEALREVGGRYAEGRSGFLKEPGAFFLRWQSVWRSRRRAVSCDLEGGGGAVSAGISPGGRGPIKSPGPGRESGLRHKDMQERTLLFYLEETDGSIGFLKREMESRTKLYRCLGMAAGLVIGFLSISRLELILDTVRAIGSQIRVKNIYLGTLLKMVGITYIAEFASGICRDAGFSALGTQVEMFGKLSILAVSAPVLQALLETLQVFLS